MLFFGKPKPSKTFFQCLHAIFYAMVLGINPPRNAQHLFIEWYSWKDKTFLPLLLVGAAVIL
jgi:hypothetical protein